MATAEARSKQTLKKQASILAQLDRIEAMLIEALTRPAPAPEAASPASSETPPSGPESASTLDISATNRALRPQQKGR